jgi:hypothetical protein
MLIFLAQQSIDSSDNSVKLSLRSAFADAWLSVTAGHQSIPSSSDLLFRTSKIFAFTPVQSLIATQASAGLGPVAYVLETDGIASICNVLVNGATV